MASQGRKLLGSGGPPGGGRALRAGQLILSERVVQGAGETVALRAAGCVFAALQESLDRRRVRHV